MRRYASQIVSMFAGEGNWWSSLCSAIFLPPHMCRAMRAYQVWRCSRQRYNSSAGCVSILGWRKIMLLRSSWFVAGLLASIMVLLLFAPVYANNDSTSDAGLTPGAQNVNLEANDPLASFRQLQFRTNWNTSRWQTESKSTDYEFRAIFPYKAWDHPNIIRFILPFTTAVPQDETALRDIEVTNLAVWDRCWGRFGFGPTASIATNETVDKSDVSLGPAEAFVVNPNKNFQWGLFNKNFVTGRPTLSTLQPILTYAASNGWDFGSSSMIFTYDWRAEKLTSAPLGIQIGKVFNAGSQPVRAWIETEYNFKDIPGASKFRILLGVGLLLTRY